ncbi:MAG: polyphosphate polymerase domain-containing protein [Oscillospiraceae bacterium]|nr:polyphosphate polymerase domain-containing protein [Oscillospiraceae bacterium]
MPYRHEYKHRINMADFLMLDSKIKLFAKPDENCKNGSYFVRSLYFDNYMDKALREKLDGISVREKFRIRCYNMDDSFILLEKKSKHKGLCLKEQAFLTRQQTEQIMSGDYEFLANSDTLLHNEFYAKLENECLRPKLIVDYTRKAYVYAPGNVRVTFDSGIHSSVFTDDFFSSEISAVPVPNTIIMEVKYDEFLPQIIADLLRLEGRHTASFSKYAAGRYI